MTRKDILTKADECVNGHREQDYGSPEDNFRRIADLWSTYLDTTVTPLDVSMMMCLMKIARVSTSENPEGPSDDCFIDIAGYAACGGEIKSQYYANVGSGWVECYEKVYRKLYEEPKSEEKHEETTDSSTNYFE